ncbi:YbaK/aminoacyl-tRNA synthetase-associated protein [Gracilaria domingensis]|nr:YbaK/aminoacyl-tRNA synthetase-associated protein [Gracilaria domingensis]
MTRIETFDEALKVLEARVVQLEGKGKKVGRKTVLSKDGKGPPEAVDAFANHMRVLALAAGFRDIRLVRCPDPYYSWTLEKRRAYLHAPAIPHLTKSIVMENTRHEGDSDPSHPTTSRYLCCIVPYNAKIDSDKLRATIRSMFPDLGLSAPSIRAFNYRLGEDCIGVTGYVPNGVTPLGLLTPMPVVVAKQIADLSPEEFWLGAGEVSLKWRVRIPEFFNVFNPFVIDFVNKDDDG